MTPCASLENHHAFFAEGTFQFLQSRDKERHPQNMPWKSVPFEKSALSIPIEERRSQRQNIQSNAPHSEKSKEDRSTDSRALHLRNMLDALQRGADGFAPKMILVALLHSENILAVEAHSLRLHPGSSNVRHSEKFSNQPSHDFGRISPLTMTRLTLCFGKDSSFSQGISSDDCSLNRQTFVILLSSSSASLEGVLSSREIHSKPSCSDQSAVALGRSHFFIRR